MNANHASGAPGNPWLEAQNLWIDSWRQMMDAAASPAAATANPFLPGMMGGPHGSAIFVFALPEV